MNKFAKRITSAVCSALVAASVIFTTPFKIERKQANAVSNATIYVETAKELDYIKGRPNEATQYYNAPPCDWCAMFVHLTAYRCGLGNKIPKLAYCDNQYYTDDGYAMEGYRSYYEARGQFLPASEWILPEVGDLIVFETSYPGDGKADHIGIVINVDSYLGLIYTIEGNGPGDQVVYKSYPYYDTAIIGYCKTNLDADSVTVTPAPPVAPPVTTPATPSEPAGPELPSFDATATSWVVTSESGCNLKNAPDGDKLGIISTGTILRSDPSKNKGEWIFVKAAVTENGAILDGYIHFTSVTPEDNKAPVTTTVVTTASTTETTTTTTAAASAETTTLSVTTTVSTSVETVPVSPAPQNPTNTATHYVSSLIGANGRTMPEFDDNNIARIIDTDTYLIINYYQNGFANCTIANTGEMYFIHTSTISELPPSGDAYTECARANYYVSSDCGVNLRARGDYDGDIICILDTWQSLSVLTSPNELGFVYVEFTFGDGVVHNGYVHINHITAY